MDTDTEPIKLKQRKPRSEAQIQALEKANLFQSKSSRYERKQKRHQAKAWHN